MVAQKDVCLAVLLKDNEDTAVEQHLHICLDERDNLNCLLYDDVTRNIEHHAILCKHCVELRYAVGICGKAVIVFLKQGRVACGNGVEAAKDYSLWQLAAVSLGRAVAVVDNIYPVRFEVGNIAMEDGSCADARLGTLQVHSVVDAELLGNGCVEPCLVLAGGEACSLESLESLLALAIEQRCTGAVNELSVLPEQFYVFLFVAHHWFSFLIQSYPRTSSS